VAFANLAQWSSTSIDWLARCSAGAHASPCDRKGAEFGSMPAMVGVVHPEALRGSGKWLVLHQPKRPDLSHRPHAFRIKLSRIVLGWPTQAMTRSGSMRRSVHPGAGKGDEHGRI